MFKSKQSLIVIFMHVLRTILNASVLFADWWTRIDDDDSSLPSEMSEQTFAPVRNLPSVQLHVVVCACARHEYMQPCVSIDKGLLILLLPTSYTGRVLLTSTAP